MKHRFTIPVAATALALAIAAPASAHVTAQPPEQPAGGFTVINFRVPSERPEATTKVEVQFPDGIGSARIEPVPGWTAEVKMETLDEPIDDGHGGEITEQVDSITWSGGKIEDGQFQEFPVSLKLIEKGELGDMVFFPAIQTYEGGEEVAWVEKPASEDDDAELESPAPSVTLVAGDDGHGHSSGDKADKADDAHSDDTHSDEGGDAKADDDEASGVDPAVSLGIGIAALVVSLLALLRTFRGGNKRD
jgi:uncharacterized protein YcnI